jgi:hypothetical protein
MQGHGNSKPTPISASWPPRRILVEAGAWVIALYLRRRRGCPSTHRARRRGAVSFMAILLMRSILHSQRKTGKLRAFV